jgi:hypothetical protein
MKAPVTEEAVGVLDVVEASFDKLANLPFLENRPTKETAEALREELLFQRATQTYLWALPLINTLGMKVGSEKTFGAGRSGRNDSMPKPSSQRRTPTSCTR